MLVRANGAHGWEHAPTADSGSCSHAWPAAVAAPPPRTRAPTARRGRVENLAELHRVLRQAIAAPGEQVSGPGVLLVAVEPWGCMQRAGPRRTSPSRLPSASASDTAAMLTPSTRLLHSLALCPVPLSPPAPGGATAAQNLPHCRTGEVRHQYKASTAHPLPLTPTPPPPPLLPPAPPAHSQ